MSSSPKSKPLPSDLPRRAPDGGASPIVLLLGDLRIGGSERQALLLAHGLRERGDAVCLVGISEPGPLVSACGECGIRCEAVLLRYPASAVYAPLNLVRLAVHLRRLRPGALMAYTSVPCMLGGLVWPATGARHFVWNQRSAGLHRPSARLEAWAAHRTPAFIANATAGAAFLTDTLGAAAERVTVIHNGIAVPPPTAIGARDGPWRARLGLTARDTLVCMLGNLRAPKDQRLLVRAWRHVVDGLPRDHGRAVLLLVGRIHPEYAGLPAEVAAAGLAEVVHCAGYQADVAAILRECDLGVFASNSEGLPNGVLECMAAGLPVVATDLPGIRECVGEEGVSRLVTPHDPAAFADRVLELVLSPELRDRAGRAGRLRVEREFSIESMVERTLKTLRPEVSVTGADS